MKTIEKICGVFLLFFFFNLQLFDEIHEFISRAIDQIHRFFSCKLLTNFTIFFRNRLMKFAGVFSCQIDTIRNLFLTD